MQTKPNDTPKIIGLGIAILVVISFVVIQIVRATQASSTAAGVTPTTIANATTGATSPNVQVASANGVSASAGTGQMRYFDDKLDAEPRAGESPEVFQGNLAAFRVIKAPPRIKPTPVAVVTPVGDRRAVLNGFGDGAARPSRWTQPDETQAAPVGPPPLEARLDGIVTGPDGFAMLTLRDTAAHETADAASRGQTVFRRVGDKIADQRIVALSDAGILLRGRAQAWLVGQTMRLGQGVVMEAPAASGSSTAAPPSSPLPKSSETPPTLTQ